MASFRRAFGGNTGQFAKAGFVFRKEGPWDECGIALNYLCGAGDRIAEGMQELADIVVEALNSERYSGNFAPNAESTVRIKNSSTPWVDGTQDRGAGNAIAYYAGRGGYIIRLDGDQQVVGWVNEGTSRAPERPLFQQAWEKCEADVRAAADAILARAVEV